MTEGVWAELQIGRNEGQAGQTAWAQTPRGCRVAELGLALFLSKVTRRVNIWRLCGMDEQTVEC